MHKKNDFQTKRGRGIKAPIFDLIFDPSKRNNVPDAEAEDTTPNLKYFFKSFGRRFSKIISLNLIMIFQVIPALIILLIYFMGTQTQAATSPMFAPYYGLMVASNGAPALTAKVILNSMHMGLPMLTPPTMITMVVLALITLITFGWQNVGATYIVRSMVRGEPVFMFSDYFYAIKRNWKQGLLIGVIDCLAIFMLIYDYFAYQSNTTGIGSLVFYITVGLIVIYSIMRMYLYIMLITFDLKNLKLFKNALIFTALGIKRNLLVLLGIAVLVIINYLLFLLFLPMGIIVPLILPLIYLFGTSAYMSAYAAWPVIKKYMT